MILSLELERPVKNTMYPIWSTAPTKFGKIYHLLLVAVATARGSYYSATIRMSEYFCACCWKLFNVLSWFYDCLLYCIVLFIRRHRKFYLLFIYNCCAEVLRCCWDCNDVDTCHCVVCHRVRHCVICRQRSIRPQVVTTFELPGCVDMWTVVGLAPSDVAKEAGSGAGGDNEGEGGEGEGERGEKKEEPAPGDHGLLILSREDSSMVRLPAG